MADTKVSDLTATTAPVSSDIAYLVDGGASRQATLSNISKGIVVTNLDVTGLTASQLLIVNSGATAIESSGKVITDFATITGTETLTNKTLTSPVLTTPQINDTSANHQYIVAVNELSADRTVTLPLLTGNDSFVFAAFAQNLSNKTFTDQTEFSEDINLATGKNVQVNDADPDRIISLPAGSWEPTTTAGCAAITTVEAGTQDIDYKVLDFSTSTDENAFLNFTMPTSYDGGVIQFRFIWTNAGGSSAQTVVLELSGRAYANSDAIDQAVGDTVEVEDTWLAQGDIHISDWSGDVTLAGTPAGGQWVHLEIMRDVSEDNMSGDMRLMGVQIKYKQSQYSE